MRWVSMLGFEGEGEVKVINNANGGCSAPLPLCSQCGVQWNPEHAPSSPPPYTPLRPPPLPSLVHKEQAVPLRNHKRKFGAACGWGKFWDLCQISLSLQSSRCVYLAPRRLLNFKSSEFQSCQVPSSGSHCWPRAPFLR